MSMETKSKIKQIMKDIEKFEKFHTVNEEHHLEGDLQGMKTFIASRLNMNYKYDTTIDGFLDSLDAEEVTTLYHQIERWQNE